MSTEEAIASGAADGGAETAGNAPEQTIIDHLSLKLLQETEITNALRQKIAELNRQNAQQKELLVQSRKEKHEADLEVSRLSTEVENITQELFEQANIQVKEANEGAYNTKQMNERLSQTIREKDTTIEILQSELSNLKSMISSLEGENQTAQFATSAEDLGLVSKRSPYPNAQSTTTLNAPIETRIPEEASFSSDLLSPFNEMLIYSPIFNQLRFDSPAFNLFCDSIAESATSKFDIRTTKFYTKLLEDLDESLKLEKAPALQSLKKRWNRKSFLQEIMDSMVTIEPLSAATESWKSQTLQKYIPQSSQPGTPIIPPPASQLESDSTPALTRFSTNTSSTTSYDPSLFKNASSASHTSNSANTGVQPLAVIASCGLCGEKRKDMNFSRLYHIKIETPSTSVEDKIHLSDYPLCINCANKYRSVVELLKFVSSINPVSFKDSPDLDDYIRSQWAKFVQLKAKFWYATEVGIWSEKEKFGLVYGWQNDWLTTKVVPPSAEDTIEEPKIEARKQSNEEEEISESPVSTSGSPEDHVDPALSTIRPVVETTTELVKKSSQNSHKGSGWDGWSGVIAAPKHDKKINVGGITIAPSISRGKLADRSEHEAEQKHEIDAPLAVEDIHFTETGAGSENGDDSGEGDAEFEDATTGPDM